MGTRFRVLMNLPTTTTSTLKYLLIKPSITQPLLPSTSSPLSLDPLHVLILVRHLTSPMLMPRIPRNRGHLDVKARLILLKTIERLHLSSFQPMITANSDLTLHDGVLSHESPETTKRTARLRHVADLRPTAVREIDQITIFVILVRKAVDVRDEFTISNP